MLVFIFATIVAILTTIYIICLSQVAYLKKNWVTYRCNPFFMPMAGLVGQDVITNFTNCTMAHFHTYTGFVMDPIMSEFSTVNDSLGEIGGAMNSMRGMISSVRGGFTGIIGTVFGKIQNLMSQFQYTAIRMRTILGRITGVMMSFLMIFYTGMQTGESINNGPIMGAMRFLCFTPSTLIKSDSGFIKIRDVKIGMKLFDNSTVTSTYIMNGKNVEMYMLFGTKVSGSHKVKYGDTFISVEDHPAAVKSTSEPFLVCLNTSNHRIHTKTSEFLDFIEYDSSQIRLGSDINITHPIVKGKPVVLNTGVMNIENLKLGDVLFSGSTIEGIVTHGNDTYQLILSSTF